MIIDAVDRGTFENGGRQLGCRQPYVVCMIHDYFLLCGAGIIKSVTKCSGIG
jgi:hypothetical protein